MNSVWTNSETQRCMKSILCCSKCLRSCTCVGYVLGLRHEFFFYKIFHFVSVSLFSCRISSKDTFVGNSCNFSALPCLELCCRFSGNVLSQLLLRYIALFFKQFLEDSNHCGIPQVLLRFTLLEPVLSIMLHHASSSPYAVVTWRRLKVTRSQRGVPKS